MRSRYLLRAATIAVALVLILSAQTGVAFAGPPLPVSGTQETPPPPEEESTVEPTATEPLDEIVETRTPAPTATPGILAREIENLAGRVGVDDVTFLGLTGADWLNLLVSAVSVAVIGLLLGGWLTRRLLPRLAERTATKLDDEFFEVAGSALRWLVVLLTLNIVTAQLAFISAGVKVFLSDAYFIVVLALLLRIAWRSIGVADQWFREKLAEEDREQDLAPIITLLARLGRIGLVIAGGTILLSHFGVNVGALSAALGIGGLAISLAAQDTIADAIAGFIIQVDRPFRVGDRIEIQGVDTWGDVVDIGMRSTRIRTRDNRLVIVPNSTIASNQVVNYTYPDPQFRIQTHVHLAYDTDIERARGIIIHTVRNLHEVLPDKPVDALYVEMGDSAMVIRVRWWIESYIDTRHMLDRVHTALQEALDEAGIKMPYPTQIVDIQVAPETAKRLSRVVRAAESDMLDAGEPGD